MRSPVPTAPGHLECSGCIAGLSERARQMTEEVEQLVEENRQLRKKAGLSPSDTIDLSAVKLAKVSSATPCCCSQLQNSNLLHMQSSPHNCYDISDSTQQRGCTVVHHRILLLLVARCMGVAQQTCITHSHSA